MKLPFRIYHLADADNWPSIKQIGLLSTTTLLDRAGVRSNERDRIERRQRSEDMTLPNGARVRDQKPMPPDALKRCLVGMTPSEWYALINSKVFFWLDVERLNRQRAACDERPQVVLEVDTERLLARYADQISLSRINTGNARRLPAKRGGCTFVPYREWVESGWLTESTGLETRPCPRSIRPAELSISGAVPDITSFVVYEHELEPGQLLCLASNNPLTPKAVPYAQIRLANSIL